MYHRYCGPWPSQIDDKPKPNKINQEPHQVKKKKKLSHNH